MVGTTRPQIVVLLGHWVLGDVLDGVGDGLDLLGIVIGDVEDELLLEGHDDLDDVKGVETEVIDEVRLVGNLASVDLLEVLHDLKDTGEDVVLVEHVGTGPGGISGGIGEATDLHGDGGSRGGDGEAGEHGGGHGGGTAGSDLSHAAGCGAAREHQN